MRRFFKYTTGLTLLGLGYDYQTQEQVVFRNIRSVRCGLNLLYQYKVLFNATNADQIHENVAKDIYEVCFANDGLYVKFGQGIASFDSLLPPPFFKWLSLLQDKAKQVPFEQIKKVIEEELQQPLSEVFLEFNEKAVASASIAQVHQAILKNGDRVAVKVQKPNIRKQFSADMMMHWVVCAVLQYSFDLPLLTFQSTIEDNLSKEIDFSIELENGEMIRLALEKCNRKDVYVPKFYREFTNKRVLISEWIDGIKVSHTQELLDAGLDNSKVLKSVIECFAEQIFVSGFVHCDPHPGNIFVRKDPNNMKVHQIILLDFGLCLKIDQDFRLQNALFWKSIFLQDYEQIKKIAKSWGMQNEELFASMQLQRPYSKGKPIHNHKASAEEVLQMHLKMKTDVKEMMHQIELFPKQLLFVNRNMNLVRSVNKKCGSPVNRINLMARYASKGYQVKYDMLADHVMRPKEQPSYKFSSLMFEARLLFNSVIYNIITLWMKIKGKRGFEDFIDQKQKEAMTKTYTDYGFKVPDETSLDS